MKSPVEHHHHQQVMRKKRVGKACDPCRLKKTKCNGKNPCERCSIDNKVCVFTEKKRQNDRMYSGDHVDLIQQRLKFCIHSLLKLAHWVKEGNTQELDNFANSLNTTDVSGLNNESGDDDDDDDNDYGISINEIISLLHSNVHATSQKMISPSLSSTFASSDGTNDQTYSPISLSPTPPNGFAGSISPSSLAKLRDDVYQRDVGPSANYFLSDKDMDLFDLIAERPQIDEVFDKDENNTLFNSSSSSFTYNENTSSPGKLLSSI